MSDFLMYWKEYWQESDPSAATEYYWHTKQKSFFDRVRPDDSLWVVVRGGQNNSDEWRLLQRIVVQDKLIRLELDRPYEIIGSPARSQTFDIEAQSDLTSLLHRLEFVSGKRITVRGGAIGNTLERIRPLSEVDAALLESYSLALDRPWVDSGFEESLRALQGGGFGDPETNRQVEAAAVSFITHSYESLGWKVESVESKKCGYDLLCVKGPTVEHVEVKGTQGDSHSFIITAGEVRRARDDSSFVLYVVTSALKTPKAFRYAGEEFGDKFELTPLAFKAKLRVE